MAASNKLARARNRHVMGNTLAGRRVTRALLPLERSARGGIALVLVGAGVDVDAVFAYAIFTLSQVISLPETSACRAITATSVLSAPQRAAFSSLPVRAPSTNSFTLSMVMS